MATLEENEEVQAYKARQKFLSGNGLLGGSINVKALVSAHSQDVGKFQDVNKNTIYLNDDPYAHSGGDSFGE